VRIFILLFVFSVSARTALGDLMAFDTLGRGGIYNRFFGYIVGYETLGPAYETAAQFTSHVSGNLDVVQLRLTFSPPYGPAGFVNVFLYSDAEGMPDNAGQVFLGSAKPSGIFGQTDNSLVSFRVSGNISVSTSSTYWLVLKPADPNEADVWNLSSANGVIDQSTDDSTWRTNHFASNFLPAFRLTVRTASVPDCGDTLLLLLLGTLALELQRRVCARKFTQHRSRQALDLPGPP
jgi:hypothetical protein